MLLRPAYKNAETFCEHLSATSETAQSLVVCIAIKIIDTLSLLVFLWSHLRVSAWAHLVWCKHLHWGLSI